MVQDPKKRQGMDGKEMQLNYPKTWSYLKQFEVALGQRKSRGISDMVEQGAPFHKEPNPFSKVSDTNCIITVRSPHNGALHVMG